MNIPPEATKDRAFYVCKPLPNNPDKLVVVMVIDGNIEDCNLHVASVFEESESTLPVAKSMSHGMNDIMIRTVGKRIKTPCAEEKEVATPERDINTLIRFNGSVYPIMQK